MPSSSSARSPGTTERTLALAEFDALAEALKRAGVEVLIAVRHAAAAEAGRDISQ